MGNKENLPHFIKYRELLERHGLPTKGMDDIIKKIQEELEKEFTRKHKDDP